MDWQSYNTTVHIKTRLRLEKKTADEELTEYTSNGRDSDKDIDEAVEADNVKQDNWRAALLLT